MSHQVRIITQDLARNRMLYTAVIEWTHRSSVIVFHLKSQLVVEQSIHFSMVFSIYNVIKPFVTTFVYFQGFKTPADFYKYLEMIYSGQFNQLRMVVAPSIS